MSFECDGPGIHGYSKPWKRAVGLTAVLLFLIYLISSIALSKAAASILVFLAPAGGWIYYKLHKSLVVAVETTGGGVLGLSFTPSVIEGISVDEQGKQHYLDVHVAYRQACLNAIEYLKKFGYSGAQAYSILGTAPVQGHISGVVDVPNACATLWLPTQIFDFDINPSAAGPVKHLDGLIDMPLSPDL